MDREDLEPEADRWVEDGIISETQAKAILSLYDDGSDRSRFVLVVSAMGGVLVGIGIVWILIQHWSDIPRSVRTLVLISTPIVFGGVSHGLTQRSYSRVGHAMWFLAAGLTGVSLFMLAELWTTDPPVDWILLGWATVALPAGHVRRSRPTTVLGLLVMVAVVFSIEEPVDLPLAIGMFGVILFTLGVYSQQTASAFRYDDHLIDAYRIVGAIAVVLTLLVFALDERTFETSSIELSPALVALTIGALAGVLACAVLDRRNEIKRVEAGWLVLSSVALLLGALAISFVPPVPSFVTLLVIHALLLAVLVATVGVAVSGQSPVLLNIAAVAFLLHVLVFLATTVLEATSGASVLIVTGLVLVTIALLLERGRRNLLDRM